MFGGVCNRRITVTCEVIMNKKPIINSNYSEKDNVDQKDGETKISDKKEKQLENKNPILEALKYDPVF